MVVPHMSCDEFIDHLKLHGVNVASDAYFDETGRLIMVKDGKPFTFQVLETYYYPFVVKTCFDLGIAPPEQHLRNYMQYKNSREKVALNKEASEEEE